MRVHRFVGAAAVLCAVLGPVTPSLLAQAPSPRRTAVVEVVQRVKNAVVNIHSERSNRPAGEEVFAHTPSQNRVNGMGTGVIIDPRGYIVTNYHVVDDVNLLRVRLADGVSFTAQVVTRDPETDLALLKIDAGRPLPTMPLGTSSDVMVGEPAIAIGNAYGYEHTVTFGVVSATNRDVTLNKEVSYKALIQTDASINPGNSGGPLLNINGEMIGVNVAIRAGAQGIGFAIPVDTVIRVTADMLSVRKLNNVWHGLVCRDNVGDGDGARPASGGMLPVANTTLSRWLTVERTEPASPAAKAGLQAGDVIVQVAGARVGSTLDLERALLDRNAGETVPVIVRRKAEEKRVDLVLAQAERAAPSTADLIWRKLGLRLSPASTELVSRHNRQLHGGLTVSEVSADGAAAKAGIQRGDILVGLHQWETLTLDNVAFVLNHPDLATFNPLRFFIIRSGQIHRGWLQQID